MLSDKNNEIISDFKELFSEYEENLKVTESLKDILASIELDCRNISNKNMKLEKLYVRKP